MRIRINGQEIEAVSGETILEAARRHDIPIPTLCYHAAFGGQGHCRLCLVEVAAQGNKRLAASCTYPITAEIEVTTSTPLIEKLRGNIIRLLYRRAPGSELMQGLAREYGCAEELLAEDGQEQERCILCRLCVNACAALGASAISAVLRGVDKKIATPYDEASEACLGCAACAHICPTGAVPLQETGQTRALWKRDFELLCCEVCGRPFITPEQRDYIIARQGDLDTGLLCDTCRRTRVARQLEPFPVIPS